MVGLLQNFDSFQNQDEMGKLSKEIQIQLQSSPISMEGNLVLRLIESVPVSL